MRRPPRSPKAHSSARPGTRRTTSPPGPRSIPMLDVPAGGSASALVTHHRSRSTRLPASSTASSGPRCAPRPSRRRRLQVSRVGIRLYLSVGPGGSPAADFTIDSLTAVRSPDGQPMVLATVHNTGGRALDMSGTLELSDGPGGLSAGPFPATLGTTLGIGDTEPVTIALDEADPHRPVGRADHLAQRTPRTHRTGNDHVPHDRDVARGEHHIRAPALALPRHRGHRGPAADRPRGATTRAPDGPATRDDRLAGT